MSQPAKPSRRGTMEWPQGASPYDAMQQGVTVLHPSGKEAQDKTKIDVVLVPGLGANPEKSWMWPKGDFSWPTDAKGLVGDNPEARILLHMYESAWIGQRKVNQSIVNAAKSLLHGLDHFSPLKGKTRRPVVFIGHSMGGLVIAKAVTLMKKNSERWPNMLEAVAGAAFFGTPFRGADSASWAGIFAKFSNSEFGTDLKSQLLSLMNPQSGEIHELRNDFNLLATTLQPPIKLCCFWEQHPTNPANFARSADPSGLISHLVPRGVITEIVSEQSATLDGATSIGLACDHRGLVKFSGPKDKNWMMGVRAPLKEIISEGPAVVRKRLMAIRDIDHQLIGKITKALQTGPVDQKRNSLSKIFKPSSWIPKEQEFVEWLDRAWIRGPQGEDKNQDQDPVGLDPLGSYIWIRGPQGRGKTGATLAAIAEVEDMQLKAQLRNPDDQVFKAYFFCSEGGEYCTAEDLLKSIITQLIDQERMLAAYAKQFVSDKDKDKDSKDQHSKPAAQATVENLWRALHDMLWEELSGPRTRVYFLLNNLHALPRPSESTNKLLKYINEALTPDVKGNTQWPRSTCWFITSREGVGCIDNALDVRGKRLINLMDPKYEDQVQRELRKYAKTGLDSLATKKKYSKALRYLTGGLIGGRASSTQWIDVMYMLLEELPNSEDDAQVRSELEAMPQELKSLLTHSWQGFFRSNAGAMQNMKEMLRTLVLTYDDPTEAELAVLAGFASSPKRKGELRALVDKCKPLLRTRVEHLMEHSKELLGVVPEETASQNERAATNDASESGVPSEGEHGEEEEEYVVDTESDDLQMDNAKTSYSVKYWLKHASEATLEVAQQLSQEQYFWKPDSPVRCRWLDEYSRTENTFIYLDIKSMTGLHIACSIGYQELVEALIQEGYKDQINVHDSLENTPLHLAAFFDQGEIIDVLLRHGANVNDQGSTGVEETPLHMAAHQGRLDVISKLTREKADPNATAVEIGPVINAAICSGVADAVYRLVECGARFDVIPGPSDDWCGPVELAALHWNLPMIESLIEKSGGKIPAEQYSRALIQAAYGGRNDVLKRLLEFDHSRQVFQNALEAAGEEENWEICKMILGLEKCKGLELDCEELFFQAASCIESPVSVLEEIWGYTGGFISETILAKSLYDATDMEKEDTVKFLLETCHASPEATGEEFGNALTAAAYDGVEKIVLMLLDAGAEVNSPNGWALQEAAAQGNLNIVKILLDRGAEVNAEINNGGFPPGTALQGACEAAEPEIVDLLLARNANPNLGLGSESPPVVAAALRGADDILEKLVKARAKVDVVDGDGETTLLNRATAILSVESLQLLLDAGANVNFADENGNTPLIVAAGINEADAVQLFLDYGADILYVNEDGKNAMQEAFENESEESLKILIDRVSSIFSLLKTERDTGSAEIASFMRNAFGPSKNRSVEMGCEEPKQQPEDNVVKETPPLNYEGCERELQGSKRPMAVPNFYQTCLDQPPSPMREANETLYQQEQQIATYEASQQVKKAEYMHQDAGQLQHASPSQPTPTPSNESSTSNRIPRRPVGDQGSTGLSPSQLHQTTHSTPNPSQQEPAEPQWHAPNNSPGQPSAQAWLGQEEYWHAPGTRFDGGARVDSLEQHHEPGSKQKWQALKPFNRLALNDMMDKTLERTGLDKTMDKAVEKGKSFLSRR
ncbi:hypothetical protein CDD81_1458 [Ophiocordyceps australis]|uniref:Nephrocystin 3-like N-terminal domain-containing protein n=1 Tax=Ophiocordyceps australis TaxID=1399860 RepID=A0A2C5YFT3_9HYPO|nr:hypothetical protein CDD81_1458 [Ophiocordyceps australis]